MSEKTRAPHSSAAEPAAGPAGDDAASRRRVEGRLDVLLASSFLLAIVVMANYLSFRHYARWDWTREGVFTLSERTRAVLRDLDQDIEIYDVLSSGEPHALEVRQLLNRYRAENQRITLHFVDPDRQRMEYASLARRFGLGAFDLGGGEVAADVALVIVAGDRHWKIDRSDLIEQRFDFEGGGSQLDVRSEAAITGGILQVTQGRPTRVCATQGHGEWTLGRGAERDLSGFEDELRRENLDVETFETRGASRVPEGCDAVLVIGPLTAFEREEAELLRDYLQHGGNLLVALDPVLRREGVAYSGLEPMLRDFGIRVDRTLVIELDPRMRPANAASAAGPYAIADWGDHPITRAYRAAPTPLIVDTARSIRPVDDRAVVLMRTSDQSFAETDVARLLQEGEPQRDDADIAGPVPIAVATRVEQLGRDRARPAEGGDTEDGDEEEGERDRTGGRLVVIGDADFLDNQYLALPQVVNYAVASGIVGWLTEREAMIELPPRRVQARPIRMSEDDVSSLFFRVVVLLPAAVLFLGFAVWWNRRT
jgi:ABC-type uncharacterized transport system involved in gliding motility auxiliary subunit